MLQKFKFDIVNRMFYIIPQSTWICNNNMNELRVPKILRLSSTSPPLGGVSILEGTIHKTSLDCEIFDIIECDVCVSGGYECKSWI